MFKDAKWIKSPENKEEACYDFYKTSQLIKRLNPPY